MEYVRIFMTDGVEWPDGGSVMHFPGGSYCKPPKEIADTLVERRQAYRDGEPPMASDGAVFEGLGAYSRLAEHEAGLAAEQEAEAGALAGVEFASGSARSLAEEHSLSAQDFDFEPSGATGFTVADVRTIVGQEE